MLILCFEQKLRKRFQIKVEIWDNCYLGVLIGRRAACIEHMRSRV
jgi:hypothetical protein